MEFGETLLSAQNPQIKRTVRLLKSASYRRESGLFVLEGVRLCLDALESGVKFESVFFTEKAVNTYPLESLVQSAQRSFALPERLYQKISDTGSPQGVTCICKMPRTGADGPLQKGKYVALDNLQDPGNLGAIARTGEALGISGLILNEGCCDLYNPKALRASMGSLLRLKIYSVSDLAREIEVYTKQGFAVYAAVVHTPAKELTQTEFDGASILVIGNEGNGVSREVLSCCKHTVTIPLKGRAESLNAAAAASILLWEMMRPN